MIKTTAKTNESGRVWETVLRKRFLKSESKEVLLKEKTRKLFLPNLDQTTLHGVASNIVLHHAQSLSHMICWQQVLLVVNTWTMTENNLWLAKAMKVICSGMDTSLPCLYRFPRRSMTNPAAEVNTGETWRNTIKPTSINTRVSGRQKVHRKPSVRAKTGLVNYIFGGCRKS